ncbi:serine/threonine-protein phosphatase [Streptomyces alfalfae]|uniref:Serine/threonine-protein phosphatase n=1 Tax=Streptomyces alfalfae TaxID=1642299 RepID=A0A1P8TPS4_9ACTN|nr:PP2C family protein-serine/threonine phosphatase [Streptomyces alfalfae]AYA20044.1 serine/threonine-protein phosphatase [Streptomyces fradiae]APY89603.1 serine/threonine protein phosphatase [Streptomyces alfalfae]QQC87954.1 serine/threonine-protein phosphatase [Streptomyces alfalfae]QUI30355.1 serine/threonine-protein phosphatase [Streptomyces alfalfae]RXX43536.1 serine/threonine-protein phosphatase [Streptomyces alfalfae]
MSSPSGVPGPGEQFLEQLLTAVHAAPALELPDVVHRFADAAGLDRIDLYLVDLQQRCLVPLADGPSTLGVDSSVAGSAYRAHELRVEESAHGRLTAWLPLIDGVERLGVIGVTAPALDGTVLRHCRVLSSILAMAITSKRASSDSFARRTRSQNMQLPAEMLRAFLPPRTIGNAHVVSTAVLEPAYEIGGDVFDHSLTRSTLHVAILDAMGHNLASGLTTAVAMAGCRNARRAGVELPSLVEKIQEAIAQWLPEQFCTGILAQLDLATGILRWCNCGHPAPLLIRDHRVLDHALERPPQPPMGTPASLADVDWVVHKEPLQPGDRVLMYTDGVTELRTGNGGEFGLQRFVDSIIRSTAAGERPPEALRQLIHSILDRQDNQLRDDATLLLLEWRP